MIDIMYDFHAVLTIFLCVFPECLSKGRPYSLALVPQSKKRKIYGSGEDYDKTWPV